MGGDAIRRWRLGRCASVVVGKGKGRSRLVISPLSIRFGRVLMVILVDVKIGGARRSGVGRVGEGEVGV